MTEGLFCCAAGTYDGNAGAKPTPRKIRELVADLEAAGFVDRGGKRSHRDFVHPNVLKPITLSRKLGDDAKAYQEKAVKLAIEESKQ
jgi:predicted RNA binding protein YcfA (HicA-like mRNA interferase family)